ncbi:MAG: AIR synthase-related protein [Myxococcota bacterium]
MFLLQQGRRRPASLVKRHLRPQPQLKIAAALTEVDGINACADVSDGLARDAMLLPRPGLGARIEVSKIPVAQEVRTVAQEMGVPSWQLALTGGEDFELLLAVEPDGLEGLKAVAAENRVRMTPVGQIVDEPGLELVGAPEGYEVQGFDHFR